jgi:hypothetical protein
MIVNPNGQGNKPVKKEKPVEVPAKKAKKD